MSLVPSEAALNEDEMLVIDTTRDFAQSELLPLDRKWDKDESSVVEVLGQLGEMGLLCLCVPEDLNGLGCSYKVYAAIIHELAAASPSVAVTVSVHNMVGNSLRKFVTPELRKGPLAEWGSPANFGAFCLSEAGAGSDAGATVTSAVPVDGGFKLTGEKMWITNGMNARWFLTLARLRGGGFDGELTAFLVNGNQNGLERTKIQGKMGIRGSETAVIHLNDVFVPHAYQIGEPGSGLSVFLASLNEGRIGIAAQSTGIAEACLTEMIAYALQREQFGQAIAKFQAVASMIADSTLEFEASKSLTWQAACSIDAGEPDRAASSMAKLYSSESANRIAYRAVQVHGGTGYVNECRVEQLYRDARVTTIYEGTSEVQRIVIARQLAKA